MTYRPGFPVSVTICASLFFVGGSLLPLTPARPQALAAEPSPVITYAVVQTLPVPAVQTPAPSQSATPGPSGPPGDIASLDSRVAIEGADVAALDPELECMAKVVHHEAANQPLTGQLAVAQLILNRVKSPLFPKSICAVVNQRGQFFQTNAYRAPVKSPRWRVSVAIARIAREEAMPPVAPGALFYHAAYVTPSWSHRRTLVARIGEQVFYR